MGNWQLEIAKMALYVSFPVALFHYFNQPEYFEDYVNKMNIRTVSPEEQQFRKDMKEVIKQMQEREERKILENLDEKQKQS